MLRLVLLSALSTAVVAIVAFGTVAMAAEVISRTGKPRGEMIDVGGHKLRLVCEGPETAQSDGGRPVIWLEAGAFSGAADFAAIQQKLTARGYRSCAYDRAGMGYSETGPKPRDGNAIVGDMEKLMAASGEPGPYVLMGHSMAGLYLRQFAASNPDKVVGLVLLDAVTPEMIEQRQASVFAGRMRRVAQLGSVAGTLGLTKPFYWFADRIGLPPQGKREKAHGVISGRQSRAAYAEVKSWQAAAEQAAAAGPYRPQWPIAVITAGPDDPASPWTAIRQAPAKASQFPMIEAIPAANHRTMLGLTHGDRAVAGVEHVLRAAGR